MNMRMIDDISNFIFIEDTLEKADAIFIPGGSYPELPEKAAELWKEGYASYIVPTGKFSIKFGHFLGVKSQKERYNKDYFTECEFYTDVLLQNDVDSDSIIQENESQCTADNARFTRKLLDEKNIYPKKAIIVCKGFHSRRCLMFYQFYFPDTQFIIVPVINPEEIRTTKDNWYKTDIGLKRVLGELSRLGTQFKPEFELLKNNSLKKMVIMNKPKIAFICVHNSCRSQMAEALGKKYLSDVCECYSAGTETKPRINQDAVRLMKTKHGIDMEKDQYSKLMSDIPEADIVISMGCNVVCPYVPGKMNLNWGLEDPTGQNDEKFLEIMDIIEKNVLDLRNTILSKES